tara:strand:+ start:1552 stop:1968 length:417 start_codon:yes stop_codon:yes gene_type:complete
MENEINGKEITIMINELKKQVSQVQNKVKLLEKKFKRDIKGVSKNKVKSNRSPSGFAKPSKVTDKLTDFMNKESGSMVARTEVTKYLIKYIKDKSLQKIDDKRIIKPDDKLLDLLGSGEDEITYFNLQKYMNKHFIKE